MELGGLNRFLPDWLPAWRTVPFLVRRSHAGQRIARTWSSLHFRTGRLTYAQRERLNAARLGSQSAWTIIRFATLPVISAALALVVFGAGPFWYDALATRFGLPVLIRFPPLDPSSFGSVTGTIAQAAAAVLALFFAAITVVASTAYAKITTQIRSLIAQDPLNRRYLRLLAHITVAAMGAGVIQSAGYIPSAALLWYLLSLAGVCMAAFLPLGIRTFALFDPDSLAVYPARSFARAVAAVEPSGHRWLDPTFQNHSNRIAATQLDLLGDLMAFALSEERPRNDAIVALIRQVLWIGAYYSTRKHAIPSNSLWFTKRTTFRRWELSDSTATEIAIKTGGTPAPEQVPDFAFVESRVTTMLRQCLQYLVRRNALEDVARVIQDVSRTSITYAKHFQQNEAMECSAAVRGIVLDVFRTADTGTDLLRYVQIVDLVGYMAIAPILYTPLAITEQSVEDLLSIARPTLHLDRKGLYHKPQPRKVLEDSEDILNRIAFEESVERQVRTQSWYVSQIVALAWASYIRDVIKNLPLIIEREFLAPANALIASHQSLLAGVWLQRAIEACHKARNRVEALQTTYERLREYQIAELEWRASDAESALSAIEQSRIAVVKQLASIVPELLSGPTDESLPDIVGPARALIADELVSMMERKQDEGFRELFGAYFAASVATRDQLLQMGRDKNREYYAYAAMSTWLDLMDLSGLALLFSELDSTTFGDQVRATWDVLLLRVADVVSTIKELYLSIESRLDGPLFSASAMRRQEWGRRLAAALESRGIIAERDFDPFSRRSPRVRHASPVVESISVLYAHPMDEPHDYFGALYLSARPEASGIPTPRVVTETLRSIELAKERARKQANAADEAEDF